MWPAGGGRRRFGGVGDQVWPDNRPKTDPEISDQTAFVADLYATRKVNVLQFPAFVADSVRNDKCQCAAN